MFSCSFTFSKGFLGRVRFTSSQCSPELLVRPSEPAAQPSPGTTNNPSTRPGCGWVTAGGTNSTLQVLCAGIDELTCVFDSAAPVNAAGFATLREIEGRLKSIKNIEKITNTMKIVASTRLNKAQRTMTVSRAYGETSEAVFTNAETKPLENKKTLYVVASSDKGLCGGIHSGLSKATRRMIEDKPDADVVVLGEKAKAQLARTNEKSIVMSFAGVGKDTPTFADAQSIADQICLLPTDYASIKIVYNKFINAQSYEPVVVEAFSEEAILQSRAYRPL